ncbi:hypothetical protein BH23CHL2_BH23CHL2_02640 [soil metagenome]
MEETFARALQFTLAGIAAFGVALWFALAVWTFRDIERRSSSIVVQVLATLVVVLGFIPGIVIYLLLRPRETVEQRYQREIEDTYLAQEVSSAPICPGCMRPVRDEFIFCPDCGVSLRGTCQSCGRLVDADWNICAYCGHDQRTRRSGTHNGRPRPSVTDDWEVDIESDEEAEPKRRRQRPRRSVAPTASQEGDR